MKLSNYAVALQVPQDDFMNSIWTKLGQDKSIVNFGVADNKIMDDLLLPKLKNRENITSTTLTYFGLRETQVLSEAFCSLLKDHFSIEDAKPDQFFFGAGIAFLVEKFGLAFLNPGDVVLLPHPCYHGFAKFLAYSQVKIEYINLDELPEEVPFDAKLLILTNPGNPYGEYIKNQKEVLEWALKKKDLHILVDEIYALCDKNSDNFVSMVSIPVSDPNRVHLLYGISKDWGMAGLKFAFLWTKSTEVKNALRIVNGTYSPTADLVKLLETIFCDIQFREDFIKTFKKRLIEHEEVVAKVFREGGVKFSVHPSSVFINVDFSDKIKSVEEEKRIWLKLVDEYKVNILPFGYVFHGKELGKFRLVYSAPKELLIEGCQRIVKASKEIFN